MDALDDDAANDDDEVVADVVDSSDDNVDDIDIVITIEGSVHDAPPEGFSCAEECPPLETDMQQLAMVGRHIYHAHDDAEAV